MSTILSAIFGTLVGLFAGTFVSNPVQKLLDFCISTFVELDRMREPVGYYLDRKERAAQAKKLEALMSDLAALKVRCWFPQIEIALLTLFRIDKKTCARGFRRVD
jgi:hypothetical protein